MKLGRQAFLNHVGFTLAPIEVTNEMLSKQYPKCTEESIYKKTKIRNRYKLPLGTLVSDFAVEAAQNFFLNSGVNKSEIDFLLFCTECPDYTAPATSCIIQHKLKLKTNVGTMDLSFGCSGYTYGLAMAKSLIESGMAKKILFITADMPTSVLSQEQQDLNFLFSDGASVSLISDIPQGYQIGDFVFGTDGSGESNLRVQSSAYNQPKEKEWYINPQTKNLYSGRMEMNGEEIVRFAIAKVPELVNTILEKYNCHIGDIDKFVFHQASYLILKVLKRKLNIPDHKFVMNLEEVGNTVSASIPIALLAEEEAGNIQKGMKILIAGFGIGYSWSGTIIEN